MRRNKWKRLTRFSSCLLPLLAGLALVCLLVSYCVSAMSSVLVGVGVVLVIWALLGFPLAEIVIECMGCIFEVIGDILGGLGDD